MLQGRGLQPLLMSRPTRNANPSQIVDSSRTLFVSTKTRQGRALLQSERNVTLMIDVLPCLEN